MTAEYRIRRIRTEEDYDAALARISELFQAETGTPDGDERDVLVDLVEMYEEKHHPIGYPSPIAAIEFRMDQAGLTPRDLVPYIGSRARVSEVLSGKRAITMAMARALHEHLGISAEVLLQNPVESFGAALDDLGPRRWPLKEMAKRGWIPNLSDLRDHAEEAIAGLIERAGGSEVATAAARYRKNDHRRINAKTDAYALMAWCCQVLATANDKPPTAAYTQGVVTRKFLEQVARLSGSDQGPLLAKRLLEDNGIALVVMRHLPKTHLDGAALRLSDGRPVVGLTLRYDRIASFWFCLLHELAHVGCDLSEHDRSFVDDLKLPNDDARESQADEWAQEALIPRAVWDASAVSKDPTPMNVMGLASKLGVHPAIVAGRVRYEQGNYRLLSQFVGTGQVWQQFEP